VHLATGYSVNCQPVTNPTLSGRILSATVGPFNATGLDSAITSLRAVMTTVQTGQRLVYRALGTAGMLCARYGPRGSTTVISKPLVGYSHRPYHDGVLDPRANNQVQFGLQLIAPIFNAQGWFWGAGLPSKTECTLKPDRLSLEGGKVFRSSLSFRHPRPCSLVPPVSSGPSAQNSGADRRTHGSASCRVGNAGPMERRTRHLDRRLQRRLCGGLGALRNTIEELSASCSRSRRIEGDLRSGVLCTAQGYTPDVGRLALSLNRETTIRSEADTAHPRWI